MANPQGVTRAQMSQISGDDFQTALPMLAPNWAQTFLCIMVPNRRTASARPQFGFVCSYTTPTRRLVCSPNSQFSADPLGTVIWCPYTGSQGLSYVGKIPNDRDVTVSRPSQILPTISSEMVRDKSGKYGAFLFSRRVPDMMTL